MSARTRSPAAARQTVPTPRCGSATPRRGSQAVPLAGADEGQIRRIGAVFAALADPTRRQLLEALGRQPASSATMLAAQLPVSRQAVVKHLATLRESQLVTSRRVGKEVLFSARPEPLAATASWMTTLAATWQERLQLLKQAAES